MRTTFHTASYRCPPRSTILLRSWCLRATRLVVIFAFLVVEEQSTKYVLQYWIIVLPLPVLSRPCRIHFCPPCENALLTFDHELRVSEQNLVAISDLCLSVALQVIFPTVDEPFGFLDTCGAAAALFQALWSLRRNGESVVMGLGILESILETWEMTYVCSLIQRQALAGHEYGALATDYWLARKNSHPRMANFKTSTVKTTPEYFQKVLVALTLLGMLLGTGWWCLMGACRFGLKSLALGCQWSCNVVACFLLDRRSCDVRSWMCSSVCWEACTSSLGSFGLLLGIALTISWEGGNIERISKL